MGTSQSADTGPSVARLRWSLARLRWSLALMSMTLVAVVASGCQLVQWVAQPTLGPLLPLGEVVEAGRVEVPASGFEDHRPGRLGGRARVRADGSPVPAGRRLGGAAGLRADGAATAPSTWRCHPRGLSRQVATRAWAPPDSVQEPRLDLGFGEPTLMVPEPRTRSASTFGYSTSARVARRAASDPGPLAMSCTPWRVGRSGSVRSMRSSGTFRFLPVPASSPKPARSLAPALIRTVALGIYSGRPDPSWVLTEAESAELDRLLGSLPSTVGEPPQGGLGYHGFMLGPADPGQGDRTLVAYRGTIADLGSGSRAYLVDVDRSVERYLLETGRSAPVDHRASRCRDRPHDGRGRI